MLNATSAFVTPGGVVVTKMPHNIRATTRLNNMVVDPVRNLAVAGRIPWKKLLVTKSQGRKIMSIMRAETHICDVMIILVLSFFSNPIGKLFYKRFFNRFRDGVDYDDCITKKVTETISEASRLAVVCYFLDTVEVALEVSGIKGRKIDVSKLTAQLIYATWACFKARLYKRSFFETVADHTPQNMMKGKRAMVEMCDKVSDFFLFGVLSLIWIDILKIKRGNGLSSIFALGGAGTLALTLACQDLAKKGLNGLALSASDAFRVGDSILLGDGTSGTVTNMGWLNTEIRGTDELVIKIPNTQLADIRTSNRSRAKFSQVKQYLHFKYDDLDKIPSLVNEIRDEIVASCPKVIKDGSRPFYVKWVDFDRDHVKVLVDCRLRNPPSGEKYYEARQGILEAIARAVRREKIDFALPTEVVFRK